MISFCHVMICVLFLLMILVLKLLWNLNKEVKKLMTVMVKKPSYKDEKIDVDQCFTFEDRISALRER